MDLVLVGVGVVRDGPAAVSKDLSFGESAVGDGSAEDGDGGLDEVVFGERTASAKVAKGPAAVLNQCLIGGFIDYID